MVQAPAGQLWSLQTSVSSRLGGKARRSWVFRPEKVPWKRGRLAHREVREQQALR